MIIPQINVLCVVDVIGALKNNTLGGNYYVVDNSRSPLTSGQGSESLSSSVRFTQVLNWHVMAIDFQTGIHLTNILFYRNEVDTPCAKLKEYGAPSGNYWAGIVNQSSLIEGGIYYYKMEFEMGGRRMLTSQFQSLNVHD